MNTFLWILQSCLALMFVIAGSIKIFKSRKTLLQFAPVYSKFPVIFPRLLGAFEISAAIVIIATLLTNIYPLLTAVAAVCMGKVMMGIAVVHVQKREYKILSTSILLLLLANTFMYLALKSA